MESLYPLFGIGAFIIALATVYDNHLWRIVLLLVTYNAMDISALDSSSTNQEWVIGLICKIVVAIITWWVPKISLFGPSYYKKQGSVFITGADSGMGKETVIYLAKSNTVQGNKYDVIFAGCFNAKQSLEEFQKLLTKEELAIIHVVPLDVTSDESVQAAAKLTRSYMADKKTYLTGLVLYAGVAYNGPVQYLPIDMYQRQYDVNYIGNVRLVQAFLPMIRETTTKEKDVRGRLIFTGTGGGPCSPCPPLLSAYMSSKFANEAFVQSLRMELFMTKQPIDCCVINPGFVKPTMLMEHGLALTNKMWDACKERQGTDIAKEEFGEMMDHFIKYSDKQPGTHVSVVAKTCEEALLASKPKSSYKVGIDSKLAPIVGMMPTGMRETIARHGIYGILSPQGTIKGYAV